MHFFKTSLRALGEKTTGKPPCGFCCENEKKYKYEINFVCELKRSGCEFVLV